MKNKTSVLMMLAAMGMMGGGYSMPRIAENRKYSIPDLPQLKIKNLPKGCKKEEVKIQYEKHNHLFTVTGEIYYGSLKARRKALDKLTIQVRCWIAQSPIHKIKEYDFVEFETISAEDIKTPFDHFQPSN